jgi:exopolyphosphatase/guanosine-5'-triphosphate,3'-diphosphate pyrophosphatase
MRIAHNSQQFIDMVEQRCGLGGAITNIAAVKHQVAKYHPDVIQSSVIERSEVERQIEMYGCKSASEREPS